MENPQTRADLHKLLESVWHSSAERMRVTDSRGLIVEANEAYCRFAGMQREVLIGEPFPIVYDQSIDLSRIVAEYRERFSARSIEPLMARQFHMANGKEVCTETSNSFIEGRAGETYLLSIIRDTTEGHATEEAFRASELKFRSIAQTAVDAIISADVHSSITSWNKAACRMFGYQETEIVGQSILLLMPERFRKDYQEGIERLRRTGEQQSIGRTLELVGLKRDGREFPIEMSRSAWSTADGPCFAAIIRDVSEANQMKGALEREHGVLRTVIDNLPDRIFAKDAGSKFIINNDAHIRALGAQRQSEVVGKSDFDFRSRVLADGMFKDDQEVIRSGRSIMEKEERTVDQSGRTGNFLVTKVPMRDKQGAVIGLVGISRDITDRKLAEEALKESERRYRDLFNHALQGIFRTSADGKLLSANMALLKLLGYDSFEELASVNVADVYVHPEERLALFNRLVKEGSCSNVALLIRRKDGAVINVLEHSRAVKDAAGTVIAFEGILEDITERLALETREQEHLTALKTSQESLAELNAQKDRLFSILSHDLRSPFTSILGFCEILLDANEDVSEGDRNEFIRHIQNSAKQQMGLLNKLLTWSRLETGRITLDVKDVDLSTIAATSVSSHLGIARQKEITLQSTLPPHLKTRGDEVMVAQVFNNLIGNALKFTPANGLISIDLMESKEDQWILAVKDTGAGILKDDFKKLFKIEENFTRKGLAGEEGTGLGLSVVHEILKKHSASITVESEVGQGTTFFVRFPKWVEHREQSVLVVDDDEGVRVLHSRYLKRVFPDAQILQASNGKEALELAKRCRPRIIVTDYSMPEMNGFEFLSQLRREPKTREIPVFVVSGKDSTASMEALRLGGAAAVLTKPVSSAQLQEVIGKFMADRI